MKNPSAYLKMRILGAIDYATGRTITERIKNVAGQRFVDEDGNPRQFTWRTIQTWLYRYKSQGVTGVENKMRRDKGQPRKVTPEELLEALNSARRHFHDKHPDKMSLYRYCIEKGILQKTQIAQTTFYRFIREYELLKSDDELTHKKRLAFCMQYANQLWQGDTLYGPYVKDKGTAKQTKLIAFIFGLLVFIALILNIIIFLRGIPIGFQNGHILVRASHSYQDIPLPEPTIVYSRVDKKGGCEQLGGRIINNQFVDYLACAVE